MLCEFIDISNLKIGKKIGTYCLQITDSKAVCIFRNLRDLNVPKMDRKWYKSDLNKVGGVNNA